MSKNPDFKPLINEAIQNFIIPNLEVLKKSCDYQFGTRDFDGIAKLTASNTGLLKVYHDFLVLGLHPVVSRNTTVEEVDFSKESNQAKLAEKVLDFILSQGTFTVCQVHKILHKSANLVEDLKVG